jgi:hypothetical protein
LRTNGHRTFTWLANSCKYSGSEVYLGLAPGIELQKLRDVLGPSVYTEFPQRIIPITSHNGDGQTIPLYLCALRDPSVCQVERTGKPGDVAGFERVRLVFDLSKAPINGDSARHEHHGQNDRAKPPAVAAFLITIGMAAESEKHFFNGVITEFLDHSWSSFPRLLRGVGCVEPTAA